MLVLLYLDALV